MTKYIISVANFYSNNYYPIRMVETVLVHAVFDGELGEKEATVRAVSQAFHAKHIDKDGMDGWTYEKLEKTDLETVRSFYWSIGVGATMPKKLDDFNKESGKVAREKEVADYYARYQEGWVIRTGRREI
jgi:hypothetical protein